MNANPELGHYLSSWIRWERARRAFTWVWRGLLLALFLGLLFGGIGIFLARITYPQFELLLALLVLTILPLAGIIAFAWPFPALAAARRFDQAFGLRERVSTALELPSGHPFASQQLEDALDAARKAQPRRALPLKIALREQLVAPIFALCLLLAVFWGQPAFRAAQQAQNVQQAVEQEAQKIEELITNVQNNPLLRPEQKKALTSPLEEAQRKLQENPSQENAVSVLAQASEKLESLSSSEAQQMSQDLREAGQQAARTEGSPLESVGQQLANGENFAAAQQLANMDVAGMSASEQQTLAGQLEQMADTLEQSNPALASELRQAAQSLREGNPQAAQEALQRASQELTNAGQQVAASQAAAGAANQMQTGRQRVIQAGGGAGQQQGNMPGQQPGNTPGQNGQGNGQQGQSGSGQGPGNGPLNQDGEAGNQPIQPGSPSDGGESAYEPIYAPNLLGGTGGQEVQLPGENNGSGEVISTGPTDPGQEGQSTVPYDEVYAQYDQINQEAIENGQVPLDYLEIIREYFDSLKP